MFEKALFGRGIINDELKQEIENWAVAEVDAAEEEAVGAPYPDVSEMTRHLYGSMPNWEED